MKIVKGVSFGHMKGTYAGWIWPAVYISLHLYGDMKTFDIQFNWLNFTGVLSFLSNAAYYHDPCLWSKEEYNEYLDKGEEEFLKDKLKH